ncbi:hypothetical protein KSZ_68010 [Dictyobacter formicarum]|uniref:Uncharacterized protein n=1 Tax=Dictyobacter formicarum TaxID=2778368 RepID=A0ABQ3VRK5_9CHLR|nr:hypothetical protein KSZ_68010 [Dictyobacter formicarum]
MYVVEEMADANTDRHIGRMHSLFCATTRIVGRAGYIPLLNAAADSAAIQTYRSTEQTTRDARRLAGDGSKSGLALTHWIAG